MIEGKDPIQWYFKSFLILLLLKRLTLERILRERKSQKGKLFRQPTPPPHYVSISYINPYKASINRVVLTISPGTVYPFDYRFRPVTGCPGIMLIFRNDKTARNGIVHPKNLHTRMRFLSNKLTVDRILRGAKVVRTKRFAIHKTLIRNSTFCPQFSKKLLN